MGNLGKHIKARTGMATFAISKIFLAKGTAVVMTGAAADGCAGGKMLQRDGPADLFRLRRSGFYGVTIGAIDALPRGVIRMAKAGLKDGACSRRPPVRGKRMANAARTDVAFRGMTIKTRSMRNYSNGDRLRRAGDGVAGTAARLREPLPL